MKLNNMELYQTINDYEWTNFILLGIIWALLFCLLSPNVVYLIHKKWFKWNENE